MSAPALLTPSTASIAPPAGWSTLLDAMLQAVWVVDPQSLRIVAVNGAAARLHGGSADALVGQPVLAFAATPEDEAFWREATHGTSGPLESEALVRRVDGATVPVLRRITAVRASGGDLCYVVAFVDRRHSAQREGALEVEIAQLQATLDSLGDGILVTDLRGGIRNFNRRFADLWELPDALVAQRADNAVLDWMQGSVVDPEHYRRRLATLDGATMLRASDVLALHSGRLMERLTVPQCSGGRPIGRLYIFRELERGRRDPVGA